MVSIYTILYKNNIKIDITEEMHAFINLFEIEKNYNGLKELITKVNKSRDCKFSHYSSESIFEFSIEYLSVDKIFSVELWFIIAQINNIHLLEDNIGFRFVIDIFQLEDFLEQYYHNCQSICINILKNAEYNG